MFMGTVSYSYTLYEKDLVPGQLTDASHLPMWYESMPCILKIIFFFEKKII